jgi:NADH:ubiquinone oxidoreductase subunit E
MSTSVRAASPGGVTIAPLDDVSPATVEMIDAYLRAHPGGQERLIPVLHRVQEELGYLPFPVMAVIAERLGISPIQVHSVVSFYHFFTTTPRGRYQLKVCMGTACFVRNAPRVIDAIRNTTGIEIGGLTEDYLFSLEQVRCLGACGLAPALMINREVHGNLTPDSVRRLLRDLRDRDRAARDVGEAHDE